MSSLKAIEIKLGSIFTKSYLRFCKPRSNVTVPWSLGLTTSVLACRSKVSTFDMRLLLLGAG
jgi:hypothetical protein